MENLGTDIQLKKLKNLLKMYIEIESITVNVLIFILKPGSNKIIVADGYRDHDSYGGDNKCEVYFWESEFPAQKIFNVIEIIKKSDKKIVAIENTSDTFRKKLFEYFENRNVKREKILNMKIPPIELLASRTVRYERLIFLNAPAIVIKGELKMIRDVEQSIGEIDKTVLKEEIERRIIYNFYNNLDGTNCDNCSNFVKCVDDTDFEIKERQINAAVLCSDYCFDESYADISREINCIKILKEKYNIRDEYLISILNRILKNFE